MDEADEEHHVVKLLVAELDRMEAPGATSTPSPWCSPRTSVTTSRRKKTRCSEGREADARFRGTRREDAPEYRTFRVRTLYEGADDALAGAPTTVARVALNDGSAQRSMIDSLTVTFSGAVILDPGAVELRRQDGSLVDARGAISLVGGKTVAVLTFAGPGFTGGSLADGSYTLTVLADRVHDRFGRELDGDANGPACGDRVEGFSRLFGDSDGDRNMDRQDRDASRSAFGKTAGEAGYLWYLDFDGDGDVDGRDDGQFNRRFRPT